MSFTKEPEYFELKSERLIARKQANTDMEIDQFRPPPKLHI